MPIPNLRSPAPAAASPPMQLDLVELETFLAVAELASFSLAAQQLHVTQPSITGRVQRLEEALGTKLLVRTSRRVEMTPQGAVLFAEATGALRRLRKVVHDFRQQAQQARQRVVVAATPMLAALTLPPIIRAYSQRYTDVQMQLRDLSYADCLSALEAGTADLAVLAFEGRDSRFQVQTLWSDDMVLVVPANHALGCLQRTTIEQLAPHPLLVVEQYEPMHRRIDEELKRRSLALAPFTTVASLNTLLGMLDAGMGAALLPRSMARRSAAAGQTLVEIDGMTLRRDFALVLPRKGALGTAAQSFCDFLRNSKS